MVCIYCSHPTRVVNSRPSNKYFSTWRRRHCLECGSIFTTRELPDFRESIRVSKPAGNLEPLNTDKLLLSIYESLSHRKTSLSDAIGLRDTVINMAVSIHQKGGVIESSVLASCALSVLNNFDKAGGAYYQAHHKP